MNLGLVFQQGDPVLIGVFLFLISMSICTWCVIVLRSIRHVAAKKANAAASEAIWSSKRWQVRKKRPNKHLRPSAS